MDTSAGPSGNPRNVYQIGGTAVEFPYKPYGSQLAFMGRLISTLDRSLRHAHSHSHALLESPTGTGKSLSLLCSALAWQKHFPAKSAALPPSSPAPDPRANLDPLAFGGGFVPEPEPSGNRIPEDPKQSAPLAMGGNQKSRRVPTIYYATRTHSQITQVIREYRKTTYRVPMAVLASRRHYCTNNSVRGKENVDDECKLLIKGSETACSEFKNVHKVKAHSSLQRGGCYEVHDIEDLVKVGQAMKGCSYFAARSMSEEAQLVFCPYSYVINPIIRRAMEVDLKGAIVIFDEAHNIEDISRDAGSIDIEEEALDALLAELGNLSVDESVATIYQPLFDMVQGIISWMSQKKDELKKHEFEHYFSCWTGERALTELKEAGVTQDYFPILQECAIKAIKAVSDTELEGVHLNGMSAATLEGLFSSLGYLLSNNGSNAQDYQLALQKYMKRETGQAVSGWIYSLNLWCLNPSIVFKEVASLSRSVILTSGTLSPMGSFASELGVQFETCLEAPHVIDVESQLLAAVISSGPGNSRLNGSYKTADGFAYQDAVGESLEEIFKVSPGGALVFFPSYKLLEKLRGRWSQTGLWSRLNAQKALFVEPRGKNEAFESTLKCYYEAIQGNKVESRCNSKLKKNQKREIKRSKGLSVKSNNDEAAFLAVFRGKVSEGIDFSDDNARVVVIIGIPFPNKNDIQVLLKKKYNDTFKSSKNLLSGNQWYCYQAFRALNQAAGRCIRHRFDYGAIIFLDERYIEEQNRAYTSKWLRNSIKQFNGFAEAIDNLSTFFLETKKLFSQPSAIVKAAEIEKITAEREIPSVVTRICKNVAVNRTKTSGSIEEVGFAKSNVIHENGTSFVSLIENKEPNNFFQEFRGDNHSDICKYLPTSCVEYTFLSCDSEKKFSSPGGTTIDLCARNVQCSNMVDNFKNSTEDNHAGSFALQAHGGFSSSAFLPTASPTSSNKSIVDGSCILDGVATPDRKDYLEPETSLNNSVSTYGQKKRPSLALRDFSHNRLDFSVLSESETAGNNLGPESLAKTFSKFKHQRSDGLVLDQKDESSIVLDREMEIRCLSCGSQLGLPENNYIISCTLTATSKSYLLTYENRYASTCSSRDVTENMDKTLSVLLSDISLINQGSIKHSKDEWCAQDGCVYRTISCFSCCASDAYLGLQVVAADALNHSLINKVFFFLDRLRQEDDGQKEKSLPENNTTSSKTSGWVSIEKFSYQSPTNLRKSQMSKSKLRLPRKTRA